MLLTLLVLCTAVALHIGCVDGARFARLAAWMRNTAFSIPTFPVPIWVSSPAYWGEELLSINGGRDYRPPRLQVWHLSTWSIILSHISIPLGVTMT